MSNLVDEANTRSTWRNGDVYIAGVCMRDGEIDPSSIRNVRTAMATYRFDHWEFPYSVNNQSRGQTSDEYNSYVVSPLCTYIYYAIDEVRRLNRPLQTLPLKLIVHVLKFFLKKARLDNIIFFNNWLLSTNIYPSTWRGCGIKQCLDDYLTSHSDKAIGFRSLNYRLNSVLLDELRSLGFCIVPSRQVYIFDFREKNHILKRHNNKMDAKFLGKTHFELCDGIDFDSADFCRAEELYRLLYIEKYSELNPQYTSHWLRSGVNDGWLVMRGLRNSRGDLEGVVGWFAQERVVTAPIVGYNTALPAKEGLYRLLTQMCLQYASNNRFVLNFSSGASQFKLLRGGEPEIEYSAIYVKHLSPFRRMVWRLLTSVLQNVAVPIMKKWKL